MDFLSFTISFILIVLHSYMFFRLIAALYKKDILKDDDVFYITSTPWEYKKRKEKERKNTEGS